MNARFDTARCDNAHFDIVVIGAGIAGAGIAAELAELAGPESPRILLAEAETHPGYHTTGRSAAFWEECYGGTDIVPLTRASGRYLRAGGFLKPRGALYIARDECANDIAAFGEEFRASGVTLDMLEAPAIARRIPGIREGWSRAISVPGCCDIDVAALHQHYLARARRHKVTLRCRHRLSRAEREGAGWRLDFGQAGEMRAGLIVNCAGAWADDLARRCGVKPLQITPYRRTVVQLRTAPEAPASLPLVLDLSGRFYFKPENGRVWLSPHDETPSKPCDAAPEEIDIALAIDRFAHVVDWQIAALERKWAGLRSFAPDRLPVYGFDPEVEGFFWCAGQGGFGIQTAPAGSRLAAQLLFGTARDEMTAPLEEALYSPGRFAFAGAL